jgi:hypothetical protein
MPDEKLTSAQVNALRRFASRPNEGRRGDLYDASAFRALIRRGLLRRDPYGDRAYFLTPAGIARLEQDKDDRS